MPAKALSLALISLLLAACSTAPAPQASASDGARRRALTQAETCDVLVDVARQVGEGPFDADVVRENGGKIDCADAFKAAGLSIFAVGRMNDPRVGISVQDRGYRFTEPQFTDDTEAVVGMDFICRALCGHGEKVSIRLQGGRWVITERKTTWIS